MRVAHLTFSGAFGGREKVAFSLAAALSSEIESQLYLVLEDRADAAQLTDLLQQLSEFDVVTRKLHTQSFFSLATLRDLAAFVQEDNTDIIHAHCHKSLSYALLLRKLYSPHLSVTCTLHGLKIPFDDKFLVHHLLNLVGLFGSDAIIGCSQEIVSRINRIPFMNRKISVIRNNLPLVERQLAERDVLREAFRHRYKIPEHKACWVGNASRLTAQKNIPLYLEAIGRFNADSQQENVIFLLAGDGELKEELLSQAEQLHLGDAFRFVGYLTRMDEFYSMLDLFVLTSDWEGTPMAALEAMSHGLPVIASSVGGVPDVIVDNSTGILFPKGDLQSCVAALQLLIHNEDTRRGMGKAAKERIVTEFTEERWVREHLEHYRQLLDRKGIARK